MSHELKPLSLDWLTDCSRSERVEWNQYLPFSISPTQFSRLEVVFLTLPWNSRQTTMNMLYVVIESTCGAVIDVEAANCCGASNRQSGTPSPP